MSGEIPNPRPCQSQTREPVDPALFEPNQGCVNCNPPGCSLWQLIVEDYACHGREFFSQGFWVLFWHRFGNWRMARPKVLRLFLTPIYRIMYKLTQFLCGIDLPYTVRVGRRVKLEHFGGMILVAQSIGNDVIIRQNTTIGIKGTSSLEDRPVIGNRVDIGAGAVILGPVHIGSDSIIGANSVVVDDVLSGTVVGGVPAKVIRGGTCQLPCCDPQVQQTERRMLAGG